MSAMLSGRTITSRAPLVLASVMAAVGPAVGDDYFHGKTIRLIVGLDASSGYDAYGPLFARHLLKHLPGEPLVVVQNMPGAAGSTATEEIFSIASKDGPLLAIVFPNALVDPLTVEPGKRRY